MDMTKEEFQRQKEESAKRIQEMYRGHNMPPYPEFVSISSSAPVHLPPKPEATKPSPAKKILPNKPDIGGILKCFNMGEILKSSDSLLILGLILLLLSDHGDEALIMALVFIMF